MDQRVRISIATQPHRLPFFVQVLRSMLSQTRPPDEIQVRLNGFIDTHRIASIIEAVSPMVKINVGPNVGAKAKFMGIEAWTGWTLTVDDDIHYPPDYVERMIEAQATLGGIVAVHGTVCRTKYMGGDSDRYNYWDGLADPRRVSVIGTGTACFHRDHLAGLSYALFASRVMLDDPFIAVHAHRNGVQLWCVSRPEAWMKEIDGSQKSGKELWRKISGFDLRREYGLTWQEINERAGII